MAFFAFALLCAAAAESTTTTALPTAEDVERMLSNITDNTTDVPTPTPTPMPTDAPTPNPTSSPTPAPTPTPLPPVEVAVAYTLDAESFDAMKAKPQADVFASFEASFATATGVDADDVTVTGMTVGGEAVEFASRRLQDASIEVSYEIAVKDAAAVEAAESIAADIESIQEELAAALVKEVAASLEIADMTAVAADPAAEPETPKKKKKTVESGAYVAVLALGLLY